MTEFYDVGVFHQKFGLPSVTKSGPFPRDVSKEMLDFRTKFLKEELEEFIEGVQTGDHALMFDSLMDLVYVAAGTAHLFGYPWDEGWELVQQANMAKVRAQADGSDSKRGTGFDVVKPEGWLPPDINGLLSHYGFPPIRAVARCTVCHDGIFDVREEYLVNATPGHKQYAHDECAKKEGLQ